MLKNIKIPVNFGMKLNVFPNSEVKINDCFEPKLEEKVFSHRQLCPRMPRNACNASLRFLRFRSRKKRFRALALNS